MNLYCIMSSNIIWELVNLNFGQLSLNLTHCSAPQTDVEPRHPGPESTLQPFGLSTVVWYKNIMHEN